MSVFQRLKVLVGLCAFNSLIYILYLTMTDMDNSGHSNFNEHHFAIRKHILADEPRLDNEISTKMCCSTGNEGESMPFYAVNSSNTPLKLYIYDLPATFNSNITKCVLKKFRACGDVSEDDGFGELLYKDEELMVHNTWQFSLELILHTKLERSVYRTHNYSEADIFYIPFYSGMACLCLRTRNTTQTAIIQRDLIDKLVVFLKEHPSQAFHSGLPHVMGLSKIEREQSSKTCPVLTIEELKEVYFMGIERDSTRHYGVNKNPVIVLPYPSYGHLLLNTTTSAYLTNIHSTTRNIQIFLAAGDRRCGPTRHALQRELESAKVHEKYGDIEGGLSEQGVKRVWQVTRECEASHKFATIEFMKHSVFCLQPAGDSPTRKSFYDAVVAGCIPVIFSEEDTEKVVYPFENYLDYNAFTVEFPASELFANKTVESLLMPYIRNSTFINQKQHNLQKAIRYLQYSGTYSDQSEPSDAMYYIYHEMRSIINKTV